MEGLLFRAFSFPPSRLLTEVATDGRRERPWLAALNAPLLASSVQNSHVPQGHRGSGARALYGPVVLVYAVVDDSLSGTRPLGDSLDVFVRREDAERFIRRSGATSRSLRGHR
jgi:hypothetical protein